MILVLLGTQNNSFHRLLEELDKLVEKKIIDEKIIVQAGYTKYESKNMKIFGLIPQEELEKYQENWQINAFEFKLTDIKKVLLQAEGNLPYCNKSWIVIPEEKKDVILNRYMNYLNFSQKILNMCMAEV